MKFIILALFVAGAYGCGLPTYKPIITPAGGEEARQNSWPWQASVQIKQAGTSFYHICSGTLISNQWILTSAQCLVSPSSSCVYRVELGKHNLGVREIGSIDFYPEKMIIHDNWDSPGMSNNIALIKISSPINLTDTIMPACLPAPDEILYDNAPCYVTGWGQVRPAGPPAAVLQQSPLFMIDQATCTKPEWWGYVVTTSMCAGGDAQLTSYTGDPGSPLVSQNRNGSWTLHGVMNYGSTMGCNHPTKPCVFTRVSAYISWINDVIATN